MKKTIEKNDFVIIGHARAEALRGKFATVKQVVDFDIPYSIVELESPANAAIVRLGGWAGVAIDNRNLVRVVGS